MLEEATLASNAEKLLPASIDASQPPMGFLTLQSAQLAGWSGDASNAQWRLLVREVLELGGRAGRTPPEPVRHGGYQPSTPLSAKEQIVGEWCRVSGGCQGNWRFSWSDSELVWEFNKGSGWETQHHAIARLKPTGYLGFEPNHGNAFEILGNTLWLHFDSGKATERQCEYRRL